jgi:hypothetical protein
VAVYPEDGPDAATLIKNADTCYVPGQKNCGASYQFFRPVIKTLEQKLAGTPAV